MMDTINIVCNGDCPSLHRRVMTIQDMLDMYEWEKMMYMDTDSSFRY